MITLTLIACNNTTTNSSIDTASRLEDKNTDIETETTKQPDQPNSLVNSPTSLQSGNSSNYVQTYEDETHKNIKYEKLSFHIRSYHIVSYTKSDNIDTYKCEIDKGEEDYWEKNQMTITVRTLEKQDFSDSKGMVAYLFDQYPNSYRVQVYNNITDNSGITSLYIVYEEEQKEQIQYKYIVCFEDAYYLIESDVDDIYILKKYPSEYYEVENQKVECANANITNVNGTITYNKNKVEKAEYIIVQGKGGAKYSAELSRDKEYNIHFTLKNEKGKQLLKLTTYGEFSDAIYFLDLNMDGYADIQFLNEPGAMNNRYDLYVWDENVQNFVKVKCDEMLSYIEVYDGYIKNWQRQSADSGAIQILVWKDSNTLIKKSEEPYKADY